MANSSGDCKRKSLKIGQLSYALAEKKWQNYDLGYVGS